MMGVELESGGREGEFDSAKRGLLVFFQKVPHRFLQQVIYWPLKVNGELLKFLQEFVSQEGGEHFLFHAYLIVSINQEIKEIILDKTPIMI